MSQAPGGADVHDSYAEMEYDSRGRIERVISEPNDPLYKMETTYVYDDAKGGVVESITVQDHPTVGNTAGLVAQAPRTTSFTYDDEGMFPRTVTNPAGHMVTTLFDEQLGLPVLQSDANGRITGWGYDGFGRATDETLPDGSWTHIDYEVGNGGSGIMQRTTSSSGAKREVNFDRARRPYYTIDNGLGGTPQTVYQYWNTADQPTSVHRSDGGQSVFTYDGSGRLIRRESSDGSGTDFEYDTDEFITEVHDDHNRRTVMTTDGRGRLVHSRDADGGLVCYEYGAGDRLLKIRNLATAQGRIDCNSEGLDERVTSFHYDSLSRLDEIDDAEFGVRSTVRDSYGQLRSVTDGNGVVSTFDYDVLGRMTSRFAPEGATVFHYDAWNGQNELGSLIEAVSATGNRMSYQYDTIGRLASSTTDVQGEAFSIGIDYDSESRPSVVHYPDSLTGQPFRVRNEYDGFGGLSQVVDDVDGTVYYKRLAENGVGLTTDVEFGNGLQTHFDYDPHSRRVLGITTGQGLTKVQDQTYAYDSVGNMVERVDDSDAVQQREEFRYDKLNRLTQATVFRDGGSETLDVEYNGYGDITYKSDVGNYTYGPEPGLGNVLQTAGTKAFAYDGNGAQLMRGGDSVEYTSFEKPRLITAADGVTTLGYGPFDNRIYRHSQAEGTDTYYIGGLFEREDGPSGSVERFRVLAGGRPIAQVTKEIDGQGGVSPSETAYIHYDALGSPEVVTDSTGQEINRFSFDPFGKARGEQWDDDVPFSNVSGVNLGFTGHRGEVDGGMVNMGARLYDPELGRFASADSFQPFIAHTQGLNRSSYVLNAPLRFTDPTGNFPGPPPVGGHPTDGHVPFGQAGGGGFGWNAGAILGFGFLQALVGLLDRAASQQAAKMGAPPTQASQPSPAHTTKNGQKYRPPLPATTYTASGPANGSPIGAVFGTTGSFGGGLTLEGTDLPELAKIEAVDAEPLYEAFDHHAPGIMVWNPLLGMIIGGVDLTLNIPRNADLTGQYAGKAALTGDWRDGARSGWYALNYFAGAGQFLGLSKLQQIESAAAGVGSAGELLTAGSEAGVVADEVLAGAAVDVNLGGVGAGRSLNCVHCAIATDATLAGRPASALPSAHAQSLRVIERWFGKRFVSPTSLSMLERQLAKRGPGARAIVVGWDGASETSHAFNAVVNHRGVVKFLDGQVGGSANVSKYTTFQYLITN